MASIRRTLSPINQERSSSHQNGLNPSPLSISPTSQKLNHHTFWGTKRGLHKSLKRPFYRCLLFFFVGFLLGILPFGHNEKPHHISFDNIGVVVVGGGGGGGGRLQEFVHFHEEKLRVLNDDKFSSSEYDMNGVSVNLSSDKFDYQPRKLLIVVTPTSDRALQSYYLHRLSQVLKLVNPPLLWVVVEMGGQLSETAAILRDTGVMYRHLVCKKNVTDVKDRVFHQRNTALEHIELHKLDGVVYFADDDNVYSLELFERIRDISHFGTWPVALLTPSKNKAVLEGPVCNGSQLIGWHTNEKIKTLRRFYAHMSGFAFNSTILWDPKRWTRPFLNPIRQLDTVKEGFQETSFIEQFIEEESQMTGITEGCEKIMNWHLHLDAHGASYPKGWLLQQNLHAVLPTN